MCARCDLVTVLCAFKLDLSSFLLRFCLIVFLLYCTGVSSNAWRLRGLIVSAPLARGLTFEG